MYIRWINDQEQDSICVSQKTLQKFNINCKKITLHLGTWKERLHVKLHDELDENTIGLVSRLLQIFTVPDTLHYEIYLEGDDLYVGPVIAVVVRKGNLSQKRLGFWTDYCQNYSEIRGLIYFCMVDGIDINTMTIKGYYYDPNVEGPEQWKSGVFPYPGVVFQRTEIGQDILQNLSTHVDGKVFNAKLFNKWEMWEVLSETGFTYMPHTVLLDGPERLEQMLGLYESVYLKPIQGRLGIGIQKVEKLPEGFLFGDESGFKKRVDDVAQVWRLVNKYKRKRKYLIQQGVPLIHEGKPVDFRVILQKDGTKEWTCSGIIAKLGYWGRIYTNTPSAICLFRDALQMIFGLTPEQALEVEFKIEDKIIKICIEACQIMERAFGIYADVGIDLVLDKDLNIWILEINKIHQHTMVKYVQDAPEMYHRVVSKPLAYAKALAGFK